MPILAAAADITSWAKLMGITPNATSLSTLSAYFNSNEYKTNNNLAADSLPKVSLTSSPSEIFVKIAYAQIQLYAYNNSKSVYNGGAMDDFRFQVLTINNSDGYPILSIGHPRATDLSYSDTTTGLYLYLWDGTSAKTLKATYSLGGLNAIFPTDDNSLYTGERALNLYIKFDNANNANSKIRVVAPTGLPVMDVAGATLHQATNNAMSKLIIGATATVAFTKWNMQTIDYLVVATYEDLTLRATTMKPNTFGAVNEFNGAISTIQAWIQDTAYLTTANEVDTTTIVTLLAKTTANTSIATKLLDVLNTVEQIDIYFTGRYIQAGGVSATFRLNLVVNGVDASSTADVVIPANESDSKYIGRYVSSTVLNLISSAKFTAADLTTLALKIKLVGV